MANKKYLDYNGASYLWNKIVAKFADKSDITGLSSAVETLVGDDTGKSARTIAAEELAAKLIPANADASLDTLQEIAAWIQDHPDDAAALSQKLTLGTYVPDGEVDPVQYPTVKAYVEAMIASAQQSGHSHSNKDTLDTITSTKVSNWDAAAAASHSHSNLTALDSITQADVTAWNYIGANDSTSGTLRKRVTDLEARDTVSSMTNAEIDSVINPQS